MTTNKQLQEPDDSAAVRIDKQCREDVAAALGFIRGGNYAWSYLLQQIKDITQESDSAVREIVRLEKDLHDIASEVVSCGCGHVTAGLRDMAMAICAEQETIHDNQ